MKNGQKVECNGFPGTVVEICTGQLEGMVIVRLASGSVCVDASAVTTNPWPESYRQHALWNRAYGIT